MAITSISRLQHRRGLKVDLPTHLSEGELGWCLDTRELFIGNGPTYAGNSQVLTQWSINDQIITHNYQGNTPIQATTGSTVGRPIGAILDDIVSVKDYGAKGDGLTDDTSSIQNAIDDCWNTNAPGAQGQASLRAIWFPAGNYLITDTIYVRPYVGLIGEGIGRTVFLVGTNTNNMQAVISTADSLGQTGANIGLSEAILPTNITIQGMSLNASIYSYIDGIDLQRASIVTIDNVAVIGAWQPGQNPIANSTVITNGIKIQTLGTLNQADDITITNYVAENLGCALYSNDIARYVVLDKFYITTCFRGVVFEPNTLISTNGPSYIRITNGTFKNIDSYGIYATASNNGVVSANNAFDTVGDLYTVPPIYFGTATGSCSSINDQFSVVGRLSIFLGSPQTNIFISPQQVSIPVNKPIALGPVTLLDNSNMTSTGISYDSTLYKSIFIEYNIVRGNTRRAGKLTIITDGVHVDFDDYGVDLNSAVAGTVGVIWSMAVVAGAATLYYTTSATNTNAAMTYIETKW